MTVHFPLPANDEEMDDLLDSGDLGSTDDLLDTLQAICEQLLRDRSRAVDIDSERMEYVAHCAMVFAALGTAHRLGQPAVMENMFEQAERGNVEVKFSSSHEDGFKVNVSFPDQTQPGLSYSTVIDGSGRAQTKIDGLFQGPTLTVISGGDDRE